MRSRLEVVPGPMLLRAPGPELHHHMGSHGEPAELSLEQLVALVESATVRGRGGAGFSFGTKLRTTAAGSGRRHVVVNLSEGEPASYKDRALAVTQPHMVLDGASVVARALGVRTVQLVLAPPPADQADALCRAISERHRSDRARGVRWDMRLTADRFVAGEASAVTEVLAGRPGLPVTSLEPAARCGVRRRPTLLSNAETFAHVGALALHGASEYGILGTVEEPGTTLLSLHDHDTARVVEVPHGTPWTDVLTGDQLARPILLGGYHGTWVPAAGLVGRTVSRDELGATGLPLGAGVVLPLPASACPLEQTARLVRYLAGQSAGRCGPCFNGLPALATAVGALVEGRRDADPIRLAALVERRGACAHPDGTTRMVRSALTVFGEHLVAHRLGPCGASGRPFEVPR